MGDGQRVCPTCGATYAEDALFCPRDGAPLASRKASAGGDPHVGVRLAGEFELERLIGIGSMSRVYRAHQAGVERAVAVKILRHEHTKDRALVARFEREARVAGGLSHPNLVQIVTVGTLEPSGTSDNGEPYLVMEFLDGLSLRSALVAAGGSLGTLPSIEVAVQIADGIGEAHARGVVHRDLKPENVMLVHCGEDPRFVKVLDFGVARVGEGDSSLATHAGAVLGTAKYACPESARGERVGPPGDVYSMATMLFECLSGRTPFQGAGPVDFLIQHAQSEAPDVRSFEPSRSVPEPLARVLKDNLAKNPADRCRDARVFGRVLLDASRRSGLDANRLASRATLLGGFEGRARATEQSTSPMTVPVERQGLSDLNRSSGRGP
jgi:serine/threonine-protein kinase